MPTVTSSDKIDLSLEKKTEELASRFSKKLKPGNVVFLYGEMGVGKTTFIRYLINNFQKNNKLEITEVTSPTFNLLNEYQINQIKINHYDLYRLKKTEEINQNLKKPIFLKLFFSLVKSFKKYSLRFFLKYFIYRYLIYLKQKSTRLELLLHIYLNLNVRNVS